MKTLKITLAVTFLAACALVSAKAAEGLHSHSPSTEAKSAPMASCAAAPATAAPKPVVGSPRGLATFPGPTTAGTGAGAMAHCQTATKAHSHMACCN